MKSKNVFFIVLIFVLLCGAGCESGKKAVPYSFAKDESENGTVTITFIATRNKGGADLYYFEGIELPIPEKNQYWSPIIVPAGRSFNLTVNVYTDYYDVGLLKVFNCPALTADNGYTLEATRGFMGLGRKLILRDAKKKTVIHEQPLG
jgi:hypothetical protein